MHVAVVIIRLRASGFWAWFGVNGGLGFRAFSLRLRLEALRRWGFGDWGFGVGLRQLRS